MGQSYPADQATVRTRRTLACIQVSPIMRLLLPVAAVVAIMLAAPATALDLPARKPGLWDIKMTFEGINRPPRSSQHCIDAATDKLMNSIGGGLRQEERSKQDIQRLGSSIVVELDLQGRRGDHHLARCDYWRPQ